MATRSIRVEFVPEGSPLEIPAPPEVHDVTVDAATPDAPAVLENPHADFPGAWSLLGEGDDGTYRYGKAAEVASTSGTTAF